MSGITAQYNSKYKTLTIISCLSLAAFLIAFLCYKFSHIDVPYFWDESWVYGPALSSMGERLPSLLAGSIDINLSRGHPMLFHFLGGIWGNVFGISVTSLHIFALSISFSLILSLFYITSRTFNLRTAAICTTLLLVQGVFIAQSAMVLPEVLVSVFALWSIYFFSKNSLWKASLFASLCLLTKESGAILMPALGISYLIHSLLLNKFRWKDAFKILTWLIIACIPYLLFLAYQKSQFGWFLFPNHVDLQISDVQNWQRQLISAIKYVFEAQGRILISLVILAITIYKIRKNYLVILWLVNMAFLSYCIIALPIKSFILFGIGITALIIVFFLGIKYFKLYKEAYFLTLICAIFILLFLLFTGYNFFSARYVLVLIPLLLLAFAQSLQFTQDKLWKSIITTIIALICVWQAFRSDTVSDTNQAFIPASYLQKDFFEYIEQKKIYDNPIFAPFLSIEALQKQHAGYRSTIDEFTNVNKSSTPDMKMYIIRSSYQGSYTPDGITDGRELLNTKRFEKDNHWFVLEEYSKVQSQESNQ